MENTIISKEQTGSKETQPHTLDAILVFGQGPVIEKQTREKAATVDATTGSEDVNLKSVPI